MELYKKLFYVMLSNPNLLRKYHHKYLYCFFLFFTNQPKCKKNQDYIIINSRVRFYSEWVNIKASTATKELLWLTLIGSQFSLLIQLFNKVDKIPFVTFSTNEIHEVIINVCEITIIPFTSLQVTGSLHKFFQSWLTKQYIYETAIATMNAGHIGYSIRMEKTL